MKIILIGEFTDLNTYVDAERRNMFNGAKIKKRNTNDALKQLTLKSGVVEQYPVFITMTWYTKDMRIDPDNTAFAKKYILDALVIKKILTNDGRRQIGGFKDMYEVDKLCPRVEIQIDAII